MMSRQEFEEQFYLNKVNKPDNKFGGAAEMLYKNYIVGLIDKLQIDHELDSLITLAANNVRENKLTTKQYRHIVDYINYIYKKI